MIVGSDSCSNMCVMKRLSPHTPSSSVQWTHNPQPTPPSAALIIKHKQNVSVWCPGQWGGVLSSWSRLEADEDASVCQNVRHRVYSCSDNRSYFCFSAGPKVLRGPFFLLLHPLITAAAMLGASLTSRRNWVQCSANEGHYDKIG